MNEGKISGYKLCVFLFLLIIPPNFAIGGPAEVAEEILGKLERRTEVLDLDAYMELYSRDPNVTSVDYRGEVTRGWQNILEKTQREVQLITEALISHGSFHTRTISEKQILVFTAYSAMGKFRATDKVKGRMLMSWRGVRTLLLRNEKGQWRIFYEQMSVTY